MDTGRLPGVFICGRQHSGNTMLTHLIGRMTGCVFHDDEDIVLEHRARLDALETAAERVDWIVQKLWLPSDVRDAVAAELRALAEQRPHADTIAIFHKALSLATHAVDGQSWARKATSYVFHADVILRRMPHVKLVYVMRNPLDACASHKRRDPKGENLIGSALGWKRGSELAAHYQRAFPGRFHIVRYEDLLAAPEQTVRELCDFLLQPYDPSLLDVPLINPAENEYKIVEGARGIQQDRANRYALTLTPAEILLVRTLCTSAALKRWYPDCAALTTRFGPVARLSALMLLTRGCVRAPVQLLRRASINRMPLRDFIALRLRVLLGRAANNEQAAAVPSLPPASPSPRRAVGANIFRPALAGLVAFVLGMLMALSRVQQSDFFSFRFWS